MTRIDFYIVDSDKKLSRALLACRLAEKAYSLQNQIYIYTADELQANELDELLWIYRAGSFVPHQQLRAVDDQDCPVLIGHADAPEGLNQVLINLDMAVPLFFSRFERVVEIVNQDETQRQQARERFKFYRDRGYDLHTHNLNQ
ncbi:MAG: DNA polymerase III subunit chi [Halobacteria archaeon]|nr:DNA polymerase III subunit chi [Halobacteria archaeon]